MININEVEVYRNVDYRCGDKKCLRFLAVTADEQTGMYMYCSNSYCSMHGIKLEVPKVNTKILGVVNFEEERRRLDEEAEV